MTGHLQGGWAAAEVGPYVADFSLSRMTEGEQAHESLLKSKFGSGNKHRILHESWSGDPLLPQLESNLTPCCATVCVWVGISWDWSGTAAGGPWSGQESSSLRCLSVIRGREEAHLAGGWASLKFSGLQYLARLYMTLYRHTWSVDLRLCWSVGIRHC